MTVIEEDEFAALDDGHYPPGCRAFPEKLLATQGEGDFVRSQAEFRKRAVCLFQCIYLLHICFEWTTRKFPPMIYPEMRMSPLKHPVAVLRQIVGLSQQELAALCGCSRPTIQAVELGKLKLSENLAMRITEATGVAVGWLLSGDPKAPPKTYTPTILHGAPSPYSKEVFEAHRAFLEQQNRFNMTPRNYTVTIAPFENSATQEQDAELVKLCEKVLQDSRNIGRGQVIRWLLRRFLDGLVSETQGDPKAPLANKSSVKPAADVRQPQG